MDNHSNADKKMTTGQYSELALAVLKAVPKDLAAETAQHWIQNQADLRAATEKILQNAPMPFGRNMFTTHGWKLISDVLEPFKITLGDVKPISFLNYTDTQLPHGELERRAKELKAFLGQRHALYILNQRVDFVPSLWRKYRLIFPGTTWRDTNNSLRVPTLVYRNSEWKLNFACIECKVNSSGSECLNDYHHPLTDNSRLMRVK